MTPWPARLRTLPILALALLTFLLPPVSAQTRPVDVVLYTARPGDNLYTLAERYFVRVGDYGVVQRLNRVADPRRLATGRVLRIPRRLLRHEPILATVAAARGDVLIATGTRTRPATTGATVGEGDVIATGASAFVTLRLPDGSIVSLPSQSRVAVQRLRRTMLTQNVERLFALVNGRVRAVVTPLRDSRDDFRVSTPVAVSAVRGTEFRSSYDGDANRTGATEVLEGEVAVAPDDARPATMVAAGFGALSTAAGTGPPVALLPAPELDRPGRVQGEPELGFSVAPQAGAARFHVQVAQDAGFVDVAGEAFAAGPIVALPALPDGTWFVRASAIDAGGLEGVPATYSFVRRLQHLEATAEARNTGRYREYLFRWTIMGAGTHRFRFQLMKGTPEGLPVVDLPGLADDRVTITDLEPGTYYWRVMSTQFQQGEAHARWSPVEQLTISPDE
jgi:hypothetical protein